MAELTPWESVQHVAPTDELMKLVGEANSFAAWPPQLKWSVGNSMKQGVAVGHVAEDYAAAIVGTVDFCSSGLEFRARWEPPK